MEENLKIPSKTFSALNGAEIIEIFLKQIREAMEADDSFSSHLTFPVVEGNWRLEFRFYPGRNAVTPIVVETAIKAQGQGTLPELGEPVSGEATGSLITDAPDQARVENGLPVPAPERVGGNFVDVRRIQKPMPTIPRMDAE